MENRRTRTRRVGALALAGFLALPLLVAPPAPACGPALPFAYFTFTKHPDFPFEAFARGELGVLQPTYARSYLLVAYRYFSGVPLDDAEQRAAVNLWKWRLNMTNEVAQPTAGPETWTAARGAVPGVGEAPAIEVFRTFKAGDSQVEHLHYNDDAFATAAATLRDRVAKFGATDSRVGEWVRAQDKVFSNASGDPVVPEPLTAGDPLLRADRAYQIAAANFYAGRFEMAADQFAAIGRDQSSPWRELARYLEARAYARKGSVGAGPATLDRPSLALAVEKLERIIADPSLGSVHTPAERLLNLVSMKIEPKARITALGRRLVEPGQGATLLGDLYD